ncbi:hypothetical protein DERF_007529 [Dermatophagoides farinae]|uniref:Uncharacterized protein n=1 Tax=Dermatophagoides farinae TaxID=6954 RepID=A0A922I0M5_DERFA|nr:hypothetical protein DERF_007529 [Dermatophagoides farinae]
MHRMTFRLKSKSKSLFKKILEYAIFDSIQFLRAYRSDICLTKVLNLKFYYTINNNVNNKMLYYKIVIHNTIAQSSLMTRPLQRVISNQSVRSRTKKKEKKKNLDID